MKKNSQYKWPVPGGRVSPESHNIGAKIAYQKPLDYAAHYFSLICANHLPYLYGTRFVLVN